MATTAAAAAAASNRANSKRLDEKHLKILRQLSSIDDNKFCFDCHQRGPTYVDMTIGSFVCTSCSGILRGLTPPHRVKSISMTSFSADDIEFLLGHGNRFCEKVWMGLFDQRSLSANDTKDEGKVREMMVQKYVRRRWYLHPADDLCTETKRLNTAVTEVARETKCAVVGPMPVKLQQKSPLIKLDGKACNSAELCSNVSKKSSEDGASLHSADSGDLAAPCKKPAEGSCGLATADKNGVSGCDATAVCRQAESAGRCFDLLGDLTAELQACQSSCSNIANGEDDDFADFAEFSACRAQSASNCALTAPQQLHSPVLLTAHMVSSPSSVYGQSFSVAAPPYLAQPSLHPAPLTPASFPGSSMISPPIHSSVQVPADIGSSQSQSSDKYAVFSNMQRVSVESPAADQSSTHASSSGVSPAVVSSPQGAGLKAGDKYAALAELDGLLGSANGITTAIDWDSKYFRSSSGGSSGLKSQLSAEYSAAPTSHAWTASSVKSLTGQVGPIVTGMPQPVATTFNNQPVLSHMYGQSVGACIPAQQVTMQGNMMMPISPTTNYPAAVGVMPGVPAAWGSQPVFVMKPGGAVGPAGVMGPFGDGAGYSGMGQGMPVACMQQQFNHAQMQRLPSAAGVQAGCWQKPGGTM